VIEISGLDLAGPAVPPAPLNGGATHAGPSRHDKAQPVPDARGNPTGMMRSLV
jgi:hypothetical protein